jgi:rhamnose utilization protein RhaD (predicted bifunctional aldolase and dehydrogenase)/NAD(P)-dependent dehydrogenase (short-subunit alcohol dehydrogenase family)
MRTAYDDSEARRLIEHYGPRFGEDLALRIYTSRLLGREPALVLHGGGNTSLKTTCPEITGERVPVLFVKGSGCDLATIGPEGFPACRLEPLRRTLELSSLSDADAVRAVRSQMLDPSLPTPSVEALLHAWLPAKFVDHTHPDAVLALVDQPDAEARAREVWGDGMLFVPYAMPGFVLARRIAKLGSALERASLLVLDKHGIFTWGATAQESYERMLEAVTLAERKIESSRGPPVAVAERFSAGGRREQQLALSPLLRGALARRGEQMRFAIEWRDEPEVLALLERDDARELTGLGAATPDHVIRTKPRPAWLDDTAADGIARMLDGYEAAYRAYFERGRTARGTPVSPLDALPRLVLVRGLGAACLGASRKDARIAGDIWAHTSTVIRDALAIGGYRPAGELDLFDVEYWSLERAKLASAPAAALSGKIALVTGAASGIGRACVELFLTHGAHVLAADRDHARLEAMRAELCGQNELAIEAAGCDVTDDGQVQRAIDAAVHTFGGLDLVVSNAGTAPSGLLHTEAGDRALRASLDLNLLGHQRIARAATAILLAQGLGGCLLFNASKSAFNQGPEFGPYAIAKSGVIALMKQYAVDLGAFGIRTNAVNADRIRTDLFGGGVLEARARARGISPDQYFRQNLLARETTARDVAEAFLYLAGAEATTGCTISIDGGNPAAFPR